MKSRYGDQNGKDKSDRKPGEVGVRDDAEFRGYINLSLTEAERTQFDVWVEQAGFAPTLNAQCASGVNFAVKADPKSSGFLASATQRRSSSPNAGLCVTARGRDAVTALLRCVYSVAVLDRTERWEDTQPLADPDRW
jgi:hypothetical protein